MRNFRAGLLAAALAATVIGPLAAASARAQDQAKDQASDQTPVESKDQAQISGQSCPGNANALGTSRVLPIDFSEYQQLGRMQYPDSLPLNDKEVVLTFDDGPLPPYTDQILDILAAQCVKATFFMVGEMARVFPATVRRVYEQGHTIGTHSDHHPTRFGRMSVERMHAEIDGGIADVSGAFGGDPKYLAPFFRIPGLERSDLLESELAERGLVVFSSDTVADDWHHRITPNEITALALRRLEARGKGILLLHDIHPKTVAALPGLLQALHANGFHVVQVVPSAAYEIAMAHKPATKMLASAIPGELTIGDGIDNRAAPPRWPQTTDDLTPDAVVLPVPDVAAFDPDAGSAVDDAAAQWPDRPQTVAASSPPDAGTPRGKKARPRLERTKKTHVAAPSERHHAVRTRLHAKAAADGQHVDLVSEVKSLAALFSPAQPAH
jgi:peptidoglycan/xylan/chitin deacetylase (PgdA/CDA1 family)